MTIAKKYSTAKIDAAKVDAEAGIIRDVAIMSIGEAVGHNCRVDFTTLQDLYKLTEGKSVKAFLNHSYNPSPTEAIGVYSGFYIDKQNGVLRASQFTALKAFREHNREAYDKLFELAATAPDSFGISVSISQGEDMPAEDGGTPYIRPISIDSADFVSAPAANKSLFSKEHTLDVSENQIQNEVKENQLEPISTVEKPTTLKKQLSMKAIYSHFKDKPEALLKAFKYAAEAPEGTTEDKVIAEVQTQLDVADQQAIIAERDALKTEVEALKAELEKLKPEAAKVEGMSKTIEDQTKQLSAFAQRTARYGISAIKTNMLLNEKPSASTMTLSAFNLLSHKDRNAHMASGGKITQ